MFSTLGVTRTPITLLGSGATLGGGIVIVDGVAIVDFDVTSVDVIDGGSVEGGGIQAFIVGTAYKKFISKLFSHGEWQAKYKGIVYLQSRNSFKIKSTFNMAGLQYNCACSKPFNY